MCRRYRPSRLSLTVGPLLSLLEQANFAVGQLEGLAQLLPDIRALGNQVRKDKAILLS